MRQNFGRPKSRHSMRNTFESGFPQLLMRSRFVTLYQPVVLNGLVLEAPVIREPITGGEGEITGNFTSDSASVLAQLILLHRDDLPLRVCPETSRRIAKFSKHEAD